MDTDQIETVESTDVAPKTSFVQELFMTASVNAAATAGTLMALVVIALGTDKFQQLRARRRLAKAASTKTPSEE